MRVERESSNFSMGGTWPNSLISVASLAFCFESISYKKTSKHTCSCWNPAYLKCCFSVRALILTHLARACFTVVALAWKNNNSVKQAAFFPWAPSFKVAHPSVSLFKTVFSFGVMFKRRRFVNRQNPDF